MPKLNLSEEIIYELEHPDHEEPIVDIIKEYLRTDEQRRWMETQDLTIADILNGRFCGTEATVMIIESMFRDWNEKIGKRIFGF